MEAVGNTRAIRYVDIKPKADGTITEIRYTPGTRVEKGVVLFTLDNAIEKADLAQAEAEFLKTDLALDRGNKLSQSRITAPGRAWRIGPFWHRSPGHQVFMLWMQVRV